jgi:hypothetical protein
MMRGWCGPAAQLSPSTLTWRAAAARMCVFGARRCALSCSSSAGVFCSVAIVCSVSLPVVAAPELWRALSPLQRAKCVSPHSSSLHASCLVKQQPPTRVRDAACCSACAACRAAWQAAARLWWLGCARHLWSQRSHTASASGHSLPQALLACRPQGPLPTLARSTLLRAASGCLSQQRMPCTPESCAVLGTLRNLLSSSGKHL